MTGDIGFWLLACFLLFSLILYPGPIPFTPPHSTSLFRMAYVVNSALFFSFILSIIRER